MTPTITTSDDVVVIPLATLRRWEEYAEVCEGMPGTEQARIYSGLLLRGIRFAIELGEKQNTLPLEAKP